MRESQGLQNIKELKHIGCIVAFGLCCHKSNNKIRKSLGLFNTQGNFHHSFLNTVKP
jgi:hypothetical protein